MRADLRGFNYIQLAWAGREMPRLHCRIPPPFNVPPASISIFASLVSLSVAICRELSSPRSLLWPFCPTGYIYRRLGLAFAFPRPRRTPWQLARSRWQNKTVCQLSKGIIPAVKRSDGREPRGSMRDPFKTVSIKYGGINSVAVFMRHIKGKTFNGSYGRTAEPAPSGKSSD